MIISHQHKFIFIKTQKTAGTSLEIALSKYCGPDDIITPIVPEDEVMRREFGYRGPQNFVLPKDVWAKEDAQLLEARGGKELGFFNHVSATFIKKYVSAEVWSTYYKFCFDRTPWDKVISFYYWSFRDEPRPDIHALLKTPFFNHIGAYEKYTIDSEIVVDSIYKFEEILSSVEHLAKHIGLPEIPILPRAKGNFRKDKRHYREILTNLEKMKIARIYAREIATMGYEW